MRCRYCTGGIGTYKDSECSIWRVLPREDFEPFVSWICSQLLCLHFQAHRKQFMAFPRHQGMERKFIQSSAFPLHYIVASFWGETEVSLMEREPFGSLARLQWATKLIDICGVVSGWGKLRKTAQPFRDGLLPDCCLCDQTTPHIIASCSVSPVPL